MPWGFEFALSDGRQVPPRRRCARCKTDLHADESKCWRGCDAGLDLVPESVAYMADMVLPIGVPTSQVVATAPGPDECVALHHKHGLCRLRAGHRWSHENKHGATW